MSLTSILSDWLLEAFILLSGGFTFIVGYVKRIDNRSRKNKRQLQGDPNDPNNPGLLELTHRLEDRVERLDTNLAEFREETHREHQKVMDKLEDMQE